ncbi:MAG TPA: hypothetical protein EYN89_09700 [Flavobacteriales bacterium]|nr:hypothetical protein [Flavobacteriales bacterium]
MPSSLIKHLKAFRFGEVFILSGFFLIGAVFSINQINHVVGYRLLLTGLLTVFLLCSLYAFNAYCGRKEDINNQRLKALHEISPSLYLLGFLCLFSLSTILGYFLYKPIILLIILLGVLGAGYSLPTIGKNKLFVGTFIHFFFQITAFHIAYCVFLPISWHSIFVSIYFSVLYAAGHLHHEVIDYEADKKSLINTGAIFWGIKKVEFLSFTLFSIAVVYWLGLYLRSIIGEIEFFPFLGAFALHLIIFIKVQASFTTNSKKRIYYRSIYRWLYFIAGMALLGFKAHYLY